MKKYQIYQPLLLRILHGLIGVFVIIAMISGFWIYDVFDGRWGQIFLPNWNSILEIHSTFGVLSFLLCPLFVLYAFNPGKNRLLQSNSWSQLTQFGTNIGWFTWHRLVNTVILIALTFALFTGQMMDEHWVPNGELDHRWYFAHLLSWIILMTCLVFHLLFSVKVGGISLITSMIHYRYRLRDSPQNWPKHIALWLKNWSLLKFKKWWDSRSFLKYLEALILGTLVLAELISIINELH